MIRVGVRMSTQFMMVDWFLSIRLLQMELGQKRVLLPEEILIPSVGMQRFGHSLVTLIPLRQPLFLFMAGSLASSL